MDFSTNHYSVVFYFIWFVAACLCRPLFVLVDGSENIIAALAIANVFLFGVHARREYKIALGLSVLICFEICMTAVGVDKFGMVPVVSMPVVCYTVGVYFAFDADFYYGEDILSKWLYGLYLVLCAKAGISLIWGVFCSTVVTLLGWAHGQRLDGIDMTVLEALFDKEDFEVSVFLSVMDSVPLYVMGLFGFMYVRGVDILQVLESSRLST